jgi:hypothetical protein
MFLVLVLAALFSALLPTTSAAAPLAPLQPVASADEHAEKDARDAIIARTEAAIAAEDFAALAAMDREFRSSRARTPGGTWNLRVFHLTLQWDLDEGLDAEGKCIYRRAPFIARWRAAEPQDPAAAITDAALLLDQAWCYRGDGYAADVPEEAWPKFRDTVARAAAVLESTRRNAAIDPEFYATEIRAMRGWADDDALARLVAEASAREPAYEHTYTSAALSLLPQWGGSYAEVDALARAAAETAHDRGLYARIYRELDDCGCDILADAGDWQTMKRSMSEVYARYPVRFNADYFAELSCRMGDGEEGRRYIRALHPEATAEGDFVALFGTCDMQARSGRS